ncbi:MAG: endonuclease/exonuclease/phosphatase family protein [Flavobacteriales bacterium]
MWWINILCALFLLFTYLAPYTNPKTFWIPALFALTFPYQLLIHFFFLIWWAVFRRKRMLLSGVVLLFGWGHVADHIQLFGNNDAPEQITTTPFKLLSWNVRLFDLYNWTGNKVTRDAIFKDLHEQDADILCLQEFFYSRNTIFFRTKDALLKEFRYTHIHDRYTQHTRLDTHFGIATFSAFPIIAKGDIKFPENPNNQCIWSDIAMKDDTIRVYNAHLASYHFGDEDYKFIERLDTDTDRDSIRTGGLRILKRLHRGFDLRSDEVERIAAHMATSPYPVVYCGDMNDVPMSFSYNKLKGNKIDAFRESGSGTGATYVGFLPGLRIDHILHDESISSWDFQTLPIELSDHRPISVTIATKGE